MGEHGNSAALFVNGGNVGIGTSSPLTRLTIESSVNPAISLNSATAGKQQTIQYYDNSSLKWYEGLNYNNAGDGNFFITRNAGSGNLLLVPDGNGNVGIGTTSPSYLLGVGSNSVSGTVAQFENSTGSCFVNPNNAFTGCTSDARLKTNVSTLPSELDNVLALNPVSFTWKTDATSTPHYGFLAQEVQQIFPDLTLAGPDGYLALNYAGFAPYLTRAIQEIATISGAFEKNLIAWLGEAANGIGDFFAHRGHFADELCVGDTCVTPDQFKAMVAAAYSSSPTSAADPAAEVGSEHPTSTAATAPVISINGDNPARIHVGDAYADLGATISGPAADLNFGIHTFVDGVASDSITIDTSVAGTHSIDYVATDQAGLAATSTRQVLVQSLAPPATGESMLPGEESSPSAI
jgi:hypothetical protein